MTKQPEALRLAEHMEISVSHAAAVRKKAAAELRRLHEVNAELVEALELILPPSGTYDGIVWIAKARAAIAKATGEQQ